MNNTSILQLFDQLCDIHLGPTIRVYRVQPTVSRTQAKTKLKKALFNVLFQHIFDQKRVKHEFSRTTDSQATEGILSHISKLRKNNFEKESDRLYFLFNKIRTEESDDISQCLRMLVALKDCGNSPIEKKFEAGSFQLPRLDVSRNEERLPQPGPLSYRMGMVPNNNGTHFYPHYPPELFENVQAFNLHGDERTMQWVFNSTPGSSFLDNSTLSSSDRTFGSHLHGRPARSTGIQFEVPDFLGTPEFRIPEFKCIKSFSFSQLSEVDSGQSSMSGSMVSVQDQTVSSKDCVWEEALTEVRSQNFTWEWIGFQPGPTERPYLTEAGPVVFDALIRQRLRIVSIADPAFILPQLIPVDSYTLTKHILLMLMGVPSWIFPYDEESHSFHITCGIHLSGMSPQGVADAASPFMRFGTFFHRLTTFARPSDTDSSFYTNGLVFEAFTVAIRKVLSQYSGAILQIPSTLTLLQLGTHLRLAMEQIGYLARLCQVHEGPPEEPLVNGFPVGMRLLTYLYREAEASSCCSHYPVLLSILHNTWTPFMIFVKDWVFHGIYTDKFKEFLIDVDFASLEKRDNLYWQEAYTLSQRCGTIEDLPDFLQAVVKDIVTCGKSINLMRICNPQHFLCNVSESIIPSVGVSFSQTDLTSMEQYCQVYVQRMRQVARSISEDRLEKVKREKRQKKELKELARKVAEEEIARLQGIIDERKRKADIKKRKEFQRLKEQMETDLGRRTDEVQQTKEEDRQFLARLAREEDSLTKEEIELEAKARDDLIAYYAGLSEEAMHRERKALWKVRRMRLDTARTKFLLEDSDHWAQEMKELSQGKRVLDSVDGTKPAKWADRSPRDPPRIAEEEEEEEAVVVPAWAKQDSQSAEFSPADIVTEGLPNWAVRGMDEATVEVVDSGERAEEGISDEVKGMDEATLKMVEDRVQTEEGKDDEVDEELGENTRKFKAMRLGGPAQQKPQIKVSGEINSLTETTELHNPVYTCSVEGKHVSHQSNDIQKKEKMSIRTIAGVDMLKQTEQREEKMHIKKSDTMQASTETEEVVQKSGVKMLDGQTVNEETTEERRVIPKRGRQEGAGHISEQTESQVWALRKPGLFGHVSQLSRADSDFGIPRLRRHVSLHASTESDYKDFSIKPRIRMNVKISATTESESVDGSTRPRIRMNANQYASLESVPTDDHQRGIARFKERNFRGHASDSTVQKLLYGVMELSQARSPTKKDKENREPLPRIELKAADVYKAEAYPTFDHLGDEPCTDLLSSLNIGEFGGYTLPSVALTEDEVEACRYRPLSSVFARAVASPIRAQTSLVDRAIINYFTTDLKVDDHLAAIRRYVLMADGDFAQILSDILNEKLASKPLPKEILNPVFLKGALTKAVRSSMHSDDPYAQRLSFCLLFMPRVLMPNEPQSLRCLELRYTVEWPLNIIFTESSMDKYSLVFSFLLQIKRVVWNLKDVWHRLKRDALVSKAGQSSHFRQIQLHRQEMEHFVNMMQGYVTNQVIHVTWQELQTALAGDIAGLDELRDIHDTYLDKAICRCLLDKKASQVMHIILKIFCLILKFRTQLLSANWQQNDQGEIIHPIFSKLVETYTAFHKHSFFLFKVLYQKGHQPHLQELLIQLNFNDFYTKAVVPRVDGHSKCGL